ncbi:hypothetical protein KDD93_09230 [Campylobacter sp. faydin G-24]|uniref:Uncharacterized protein n=1 Tax=Campylobacter anatolicus TaxID=2829105 RepID=A0ABS5HLU0_9BACT|nr:hypothetical protein [Campylobacter anatolicus]MBR8461490.1 hypothetical protein [Campylobacter anatolicus]MBR8464737.1 hypothetical protein [Campylobacter anatolicus]
MSDTLRLYYAVLDYITPNWQTRADDYYLVELSFLLREVFGCVESSDTVTKNLKISRVSRYKNELEAVLKTDIRAIRWILRHRMNKDRLKACMSRYLKDRGGEDNK